MIPLPLRESCLCCASNGQDIDFARAWGVKWPRFAKILTTFTKKVVWDKNNYWTRLNLAIPNWFQIRKLELDIWTFGRKKAIGCLPKSLLWPKYPDIQIFGSPKFDQNLTQIWNPVIFLSKSGKKVTMSGQSVFCLNLVLLQFRNI